MGRDNPLPSRLSGCVSFYPRARMGRDVKPAAACLVLSRFYPRARMGRDAPADRKAYAIYVSIRAPAWDATSSVCSSIVRRVFLSARPHGTRHSGPKRYSRVIRFLSARPHGTRQYPRSTPTGPRSFYPRARMGRDVYERLGRGQPHVSIRAPAWDATSTIAQRMSFRAFLSARPHGTRPFKSKLLKNIRKVFTFR